MRAAGILVIASATNLAEARAIASAGLDAVVAQGFEAGGHRGVFDPDASWVLRDKSNGALVGMLLCSRVASDVAHITQLCVATAYRGQRLGLTLLEHCIHHLTRSRFAAITLTVTEANHQAVKLYQDSGFFTRHRFDAMVLDKS